MKKTKKYYRDLINADYTSACSILKEAMDRYGDKLATRGHRKITIDRVSNNWNGSITGFCFNKFTNKLSVQIYWQGDSTDGDGAVEFNPNGITLRQESYWTGSHTRIEHSDVHFDKDQLWQAMKNFATKYLK